MFRCSFHTLLNTYISSASLKYTNHYVILNLELLKIATINIIDVYYVVHDIVKRTCIGRTQHTSVILRFVAEGILNMRKRL